MNTFRLPYRNGLVDFSQPTQSQSQSRSNAKAADSADEAENLLQSESFLKRIEAVREQDKRFQLNRDVRINFVEVKQRQTKKAPPVMVHAFQMAKDMGLNVFWIPLEQLDKLLQQSGSHVLILGTFKDDLYRRLVREPRVRIFGPMCVDYCNIRLNQLLPARLISPYTLCMRHTFVTFAGLESKLQNRLVLFVQLMGGHVSRPYRGGITHVIAATQLASKCVMARKESIPIMKSDWVIKLWERSINDSIDAFSASLYRSHRLPIFAGLKICGSQIDERERVKAIVEENGGEYQGKFIRAEVTHLVLGVPKGDKYSAAKKLSHVKVVKLAWIEESVTKGYLLPEEEFSWKNDSAQTPSKAFPTTRSAITQSASNAFIVEDTMDKMGAMTFAKKEPSNVSVFTGMFPSTNRLQTQSDQSITSINNTQNMTTKEKTNTCAFFERFQSKSGANNSSTINKKMTLAEELKAILDKSTSRISSVFDGCVFFTVGCPTDLTTLLRKCVTVRGGYLFDELRNSTTHIVCGRDTSAKDHEMCDNHINKSDHNIFKFDFDWLLTCLRQNKLLNAPNSIASQSNVTNRTESQSSEYRIVLNDTSQIGNVAQTSNSTIQRKSRILMRMDESDKGEDDFLKDYLSQPSQSQLNTANLTRTVSISSPPAKKQQPTQNTLTGNGNEMRSMISTPQPEPQPSSSGLAMPSTSGINLTSSTNLIIPSTNRPENDTMSELSLSLSYNLQPAIGLPLQNCVITFSGYYESEREEYKKIARTLGAVCQDVFSLRQHSNQNIRANTHLICDKQEGPKYEKSLQWKVHSVDKQWLMDCQKHNRRMNESLYLTGQMTGTQSKNTFIEEVSKNDYDTLDSSSQFQAKLRTVSSYFLPPAPLQPCTIDEPIRPINILPQTKTDDSLQGIPIAWNDRDAHVRSVPNKDDDVSQFSFSRNPLIMLCGLTVPEKLQFSRIIDRLGGRLADDKETRHDVLVTCDTTKNEKFFTSLCTGKWIVHPDFLTKSADAGHFLSPQQFEWGTNKELTARLSPSLFDCAQACPRWRDEVARMGHGAFNRHHVVVVGIRPSSFVTIINSGGGRAREVKVASKDANSYAIIMKSLTAKIRQERSESRLSYILIDYPRSLHKVMRQLALPLHELGVCCAPVEYISHYLLLYPSPQVRLYDISQCEEKLGIEVSRSGIRKRNSDTDEASTPSKRAKN